MKIVFYAVSKIVYYQYKYNQDIMLLIFIIRKQHIYKNNCIKISTQLQHNVVREL